MEEKTQNKLWLESDETAKMRIDQAKTLREKIATESGLSFEAYLIPSLAEWVLQMVEDGDFVDPCEAVFVFMQQAKELHDHEDLRTELLKRRLQKSMDDPRPSIPAEEALKEIRAETRNCDLAKNR